MWQFTSGAFLGWGLGSNDAANVFGIGVATNLVRFRTAAILISVFVLLGAAIEGPKCITTVGKLSNLIPLWAFFATLSAGIVMLVMSRLALPSSSSQAIVGALLAVGFLNGSANFAILSKVVLCWILTPVGAALVSVFLFPVLRFVLRPFIVNISLRTTVLRAAVILSGCYGSYALGGNNVANVAGVYVASGQMTPLFASLFGGFFISLGVVTYGKNVMMTVGKGIFALDAFTAFVAVLAQAVTIHLFTQFGVPVSGSQAIVGAVIGIGFLKDMTGLSKRKIFEIFLGWLLTPVSACLICLVFLSIFG
ncbi:anion permease [candidate division KSB1 bacterium]|nr:anion permease [candidate division KSB1 bacterium]